MANVEFPPNLAPIRLLGHGSMATVFLARNRSLKRLVAVKFLRPELSRDATSRRRFEREAQAAARLSHDGVTRVYSVGRLRNGEPFIEMEHIDGNNLADTLRRQGPLEVGKAAALLTQIASALAAAHDESIVHRDVKPANILIDNKTGRAVLTDFGVAAILETGTETITQLTRENERIGNPRYMSPEQLRGEVLTGQSDVYSLGVVAYELLTGKGPFDDPEIRDVAGAHLRRPPPDLKQMRLDIPQTLSDTLKKCLAKKPEHRPLARDLTAVFEDPHDDVADAKQPAGPITGFLYELKQRKVYQTAVAYAAVTFLILQVADLLLQPWPDLDVLYQLIVVACLAGFPFAIVLAWIFDLRKGRLVRTDDAQSAFLGNATRAQRSVLMLTGLGLTVALVLSVAWWLLS